MRLRNTHVAATIVSEVAALRVENARTVVS